MPNPSPSDPYTYTTQLQPPPGDIIAPNGFPTPPFPASAPPVFRDAMKIRLKVFCVEQHCAVEPELDEDDPRSWSWVVYRSWSGGDRGNGDDEAKGEPVSTIRIVPPPHGAHPNGFVDPEEKPYVKLTRVATVREARGKGISKRLIEEALAWLGENPGEVGNGWDGLVLTHAQSVIERMYAKMGFVTDEKLGRWDEEGIEHLGMWRKIEVKR